VPVVGFPSNIRGVRAVVAPSSTPITGITFDWSTHRREAVGSDNWPITWADNDKQYTSGGDGFGWATGRTKTGQFIVEISGDASSYTGVDRYYPSSESNTDADGKSYGIIAVSGNLYMWLSPGSGVNNYNSHTLYKSTNDGLTWTTTGVTFDKATYNLLPPAILQFGQNYANARDGYIYHYFGHLDNDASLSVQDNATNGGQIWLARCLIADIETQANYEWFTGTSGSPSWGVFASKTEVFQSNDGISWNTGSVNWVPGLNRYLLATERTTTFVGNMGLFEAPEPWGPWTQIHYEANWPQDSTGSPVDATTEQTAFYWTFSPKWWDQSGNGVLLASGVTEMDSWNSIEINLSI